MKESALQVEKPEESPESLRLKSFQDQIDEIQTKLESMSKAAPQNKLSMIVFSGDLDKVLASFVIATGAEKAPFWPNDPAEAGVIVFSATTKYPVNCYNLNDYR